MSFQVSESHREEFLRDGVTVFKGILPPSLIRDLRRVCEKGRELGRQKRGAQAQRFQPVSAFDIDQKPFEDYRDLPELREAFSAVLSPQHQHGNLDVMGVLIEPAEQSWCTAWHRDARDMLDDTEWEYYRREVTQINCALYEDSSTWYVRGSHLRGDTSNELTMMSATNRAAPNLEGLEDEERERICHEYCASMPEGECLRLNAGDLALYLPAGWHTGNYVPYRRRATLHEGAWTPEIKEWWMTHVGRDRNKRIAAENAKIAAANRDGVETHRPTDKYNR
jgi:hypothetical protein